MYRYDKQLLCPVTLELIKNGKAKQLTITRLDCYSFDYDDLDNKWATEYERMIRDDDIDALRSIIYLDNKTITTTTPYKNGAVKDNTRYMRDKVIAYIILQMIEDNGLTRADELKNLKRPLDDFDYYAQDELTRSNVKDLVKYLTDYLER